MRTQTEVVDPPAKPRVRINETAVCDFCEVKLKRNYGGRFDQCHYCKKDVCDNHHKWWDHDLVGDYTGDNGIQVCNECADASASVKSEINSLQEQIDELETQWIKSRKDGVSVVRAVMTEV